MLNKVDTVLNSGHGTVPYNFVAHEQNLVTAHTNTHTDKLNCQKTLMYKEYACVECSSLACVQLTREGIV